MSRPKVDPETAARFVVDVLQDSGHKALYAGGCVRDRLLGREANDYDVATSAEPAQVRSLFRRTLKVGEQFGIVIVLYKGQQVEVATFRSDGDYKDGRHPEGVEYTDDPAVDAQRRDFTINGLFFDPALGKVYDYVGGEADIERGVIRAIGDPARRFDEDKLRILRAPRFAAMLGFEIEESTAAEARARAEEIRSSGVSQERILVELNKLLSYPGRAHGIRLCHELGVLAVVLPEATGDVDRAVRGLEALEPECPQSLPWAVLLAGAQAAVAEKALRRLKASNKQREAVVALVRDLPQARRATQLSVAERKRLLRKHGPELEELVRVTELASDRGPEASAFLAARRAEYTADTSPAGLNARPLIGGKDLAAAGVAPGPLYGKVLPQVEEAQLEGRVTTVEEALSLALELAKG